MEDQGADTSHMAAAHLSSAGDCYGQSKILKLSSEVQLKNLTL